MNTSVRWRTRIPVAICLCGLWLVGAGRRRQAPAPEASPVPVPSGERWFEDVAADRNLDFVYVAGFKVDPYLMPRIPGSGEALMDYDNDGLLDVFESTPGSQQPLSD